MSGPRHKGRESALQIMYQVDHGALAEEAITGFFAYFALSKAGRELADSLVHGVVEHQSDIDKKITDCSHKWRVDRMAVVDRNVLRLAVFELFHAPDPQPKKVILNEWIEVAKRYGAEHSSAFVNGILDSML
ncbi:MAG: transcription antitermination factor NusB [Deltaproteobacteria bacterium]|nr:transcription antitermination factor NusB [Deltaproteobacteria bacterium]